jgi:hypothetical protein
MNKLLAMVCLGFLLTFQTTTKAQVLDSMMEVYANRYPQEKVHLQFDKGAYNKGETIWYKAYLMTGIDLSYISKNFYVDWYDGSGNLLMHTVAPLFQATASGSFDVPANYSGNKLEVRAYTRWMLNFDTAFLYHRTITVIQPQVKTSIAIPKTQVYLFPEGGNLVNGLNCRVAFKATNQFGNPVFIKGAIKNNKQELIDSFMAEHDGMGSFSVEPKAGETYQIYWMDENGQSGTTALPAALPNGATLSVQPAPDKAILFVERSANDDPLYKTMYLMAQMNQQLVYKSRINFSAKTSVVADLPTTELPTGILQVTLFNANWIPVAERIVFVNNDNYSFQPRVSFPTVNLSKRGKNTIEFFVSDTAFANMSVAVTDADVPVDDKHSIYTDFLLSDDIKGKVYNPAYYFSSNADSVVHHLDLVMMTNGWRRYNWADLAALKTPAIKYPPETNFLKIEGKVYGSNNLGGESSFLNVIVQGKDSSKQFLLLPVRRDGSFEQDGVFFYDTVKLFYMLNGKRSSNSGAVVSFTNGLYNLQPRHVSINSTLTNWSDSMALRRMQYFMDEQERLRKLMASATLKEVTVRAKVKSALQVLDEKYATGLFSGGDSYGFDVMDDPRANSALDIFTYLQGQVAGLQINMSGGTPSLTWRGSTPDLYLDESPAQPDMIQSLPITDVAYIKVFRPPFFGSMGGGSGGAIAIYTKRGNDGKKNNNANTPGLDNTILGGYTRFKQFFNPDYEKSTDAFGDDVRSTLYWNPFVLTNKKSPQVKLDFFNNDISKKLKVIIEGFNADGKLTHIEKVLE